MEFTNVVDRFVLGLSCNKIVNDVQIKVLVEDEITKLDKITAWMGCISTLPL